MINLVRRILSYFRDMQETTLGTRLLQDCQDCINSLEKDLISRFFQTWHN